MSEFSLKAQCQKAVFIVAEIGNNHNGSIQQALNLVDIAAEARVDAVKFQTFRGLDIVTPLVLASEYSGWEVNEFRYWHEFLDSIALPLEEHRRVFEYAGGKGILPFSTPTSPALVDFLETLEVPVYKIASMDLTNIPLLKRVAATKKPVIVSTGMANESEIRAAADILAHNELAILHCISDYPTQPQNANLRTIEYLKENFDAIPGLSDHSISNEFALGAVSLGARIIEKHITYSRRAVEKAEHHFALEPDELSALVKSVRILEQGLGEVTLGRSPDEQANREKYRRSLHVNQALKKGTRVEPGHLSILRPNTGDSPSSYEYYLGKRLAVDVSPWTSLRKDMVSEE